MEGGAPALSKAAKKNKKRNKAKKKDVPDDGNPESSSGVTLQDLIPVMKQELQEAKERKEHDRAGKLRDQIWVLTDLAAGVRTDLPHAELQPIVEEINKFIEAHGGTPDRTVYSKTSSSQPVSKRAEQPSAASSSGSGGEDRKLRNLRKKLKQIEELKEKQAKGVKLEDGQIEKIKSEEKVREEIEELEDLIEQVALEIKH